eukprot:4240563-Alexandrium_andersonii.AAC.1
MESIYESYTDSFPKVVMGVFNARLMRRRQGEEQFIGEGALAPWGLPHHLSPEFAEHDHGEVFPHQGHANRDRLVDFCALNGLKI